MANCFRLGEAHRFFNHFRERLPDNIPGVPPGPLLRILCYRCLAAEPYSDGPSLHVLSAKKGWAKDTPGELRPHVARLSNVAGPWLRTLAEWAMTQSSSCSPRASLGWLVYHKREWGLRSPPRKVMPQAQQIGPGLVLTSSASRKRKRGVSQSRKQQLANHLPGPTWDPSRWGGACLVGHNRPLTVETIKLSWRPRLNAARKMSSWCSKSKEEFRFLQWLWKKRPYITINSWVFSSQFEIRVSGIVAREYLHFCSKTQNEMLILVI